MSKQVSGALSFGTKLKSAIKENRITSLLITATTFTSEFAKEYFVWFFVLTVGYIIFDRAIRLWELPHIKKFDESQIKSDVIQKQEYVRGQILKSRADIIDRMSKVNTAVTLRLIGNSENLEDAGNALSRYIKESKSYEDVLDDISKDIDVPYEDFLMNDANISNIPTTVSAEKKFKNLEILTEKE